jgi:hypothetical protein
MKSEININNFKNISVEIKIAIFFIFFFEKEL